METVSGSAENSLLLQEPNPPAHILTGKGPHPVCRLPGLSAPAGTLGCLMATAKRSSSSFWRSSSSFFLSYRGAHQKDLQTWRGCSMAILCLNKLLRGCHDLRRCLQGLAGP